MEQNEETIPDAYSINIRMTAKGEFYGDFSVKAPDEKTLRERLRVAKQIFLNEVR